MIPVLVETELETDPKRATIMKAGSDIVTVIRFVIYIYTYIYIYTLYKQKLTL